MTLGIRLGLRIGVGAPVGSFTLKSIAGLYLWYRADAVVVTGAGISQWTDLGGNGRHAVQTTDANRPALEASSFAGKPCAHSAGQQWCNIPDLSALTAGHIFAAVQADGDPAGGSGASGIDGQLWRLGTGASTFYPYSDGVIYESAGTSVRKDGITKVPSLALKHVYEVVSTDAEYTVKLDGAQLFTTDTNTVGFHTLPRFCGWGANTWKGRTAELAIFSAKLSASDALKARAAMGGSYGVTVS